MSTSWHGCTFHIIGLLCGDPPAQRASDTDLWWPLLVSPFSSDLRCLDIHVILWCLCLGFLHCIALTGELWGVSYENFGENWLCYNSTALYIFVFSQRIPRDNTLSADPWPVPDILSFPLSHQYNPSWTLSTLIYIRSYTNIPQSRQAYISHPL